jgi:transcriptional regulator with XRE-family HTH domain
MSDETVGDRIVRIAAANISLQGLNRRKLADALGVTYETLRKWMAGTNAPNRSRAEGIANVLGVPPETFMHGVEYGVTNGTPDTVGRGLAHDLSQPRSIVNPTTIEWDELMARELPETFALAVKDDAMAPLLNVGNVARFSTSRAATPGKRVLVADRDGHAYIREYRVRRGDHWQAVALNAAYEPMDSVADGLTVLAVMTGLDWE